jgi:hypothetical protein
VAFLPEPEKFGQHAVVAVLPSNEWLWHKFISRQHAWWAVQAFQAGKFEGKNTTLCCAERS